MELSTIILISTIFVLLWVGLASLMHGSRSRKEPQPQHEEEDTNHPYFLVTEGQLRELLKACKKLHSFMMEVGSEPEVRKAIDEAIGLTNNDGTPWETWRKVQVTMFADVYRLLRDMGGDIGKNQSADLGVMLFCAMVLEPNFTLERKQLGKFYHDLVPQFTDTLDIPRQMYDAASLAPGHYLFEYAMQDVNHPQTAQFMELMQQLQQAIKQVA